MALADSSPSRSWGYLGASVLLSLIVHLLLGSGLTYSDWGWTKKAPESPTQPTPALTTRVLTPAEVARLDRVVPPPPDESRPLVQTEFDSKRLVRAPKDRAKAVAERTQRVERETVAANPGSVTGGSGGKSRAGSPREETTAEPPAKSQSLERFGVSESMSPSVATRPRDGRTAEARDDSESGDARKTGIVNYGTLDAHDRPIAVDTKTLLNTDEYVHAGFFNRARDQIYARWVALLQKAINARKPRPDVYETMLKIRVDPKSGDVREVLTTRPSGLDLFDLAAATSVRQVIRFEHPPSALVDQEGLASFDMSFTVNLEPGSVIQFRAVPQWRERDH